ncbi:MAG: hypothetical protein ACOH5I_08620 [Oligoflexus sp.]
MWQRTAGLNVSFTVVAAFVGLTACRGQSGDPFASGSAAGQVTTLTGSVRSITGSQNEMANWVLVMMERDTGVSRVNEIGPVGNYELKGINVQQPHTLLLLDPQYRFSAILTYPGELENTVLQYFTMVGERLPTLVQNGPVINFTDTEQIFWENNFASDSDGNLIPDGLEISLLMTQDIADSDGDGINNWEDPDIDGNGIPNWFDSDADGDGIADIFDADANGDELADITQTEGDVYFETGLAYILAQVTQDVQADGSLATTLLLTTKIHENLASQEISVRGASSLFTGAVAVKAAETAGSEQTSTWDGLLHDDGQNEDGAAEDSVYARQVRLAAGVTPQANQVLFFRVSYGEGESQYYDEFPYTFPNVTTGVISGSYDPVEGIVSKSGQPFGTVTTYSWSVHIFDASGVKVYSSQPLAGADNQFTIPPGVLGSSQTYVAKVVASSLARVPSYPAWIIRSESFDLQ